MKSFAVFEYFDVDSGEQEVQHKLLSGFGPAAQGLVVQEHYVAAVEGGLG